MMKITFVCTGNTCRSSMAEALARKWVQTNNVFPGAIELASAGLLAGHGSPASPQAIEVMGLRGIDLTLHWASQFTAETAVQSDIILTMTENHKLSVLRLFPTVATKVFTLAEFAGWSGIDISDPYGQSPKVYEQCARQLEELVGQALHTIITKQGRY